MRARTSGRAGAALVVVALGLGAPGCGREVPARTGLWAVLVAGSSGIADQRHQNDVVAQHAVLRANGVPEDRIIVVAADEVDMPMRYALDEPSITTPLVVDYRLADVDAVDIAAIVTGRRTATTPVVVDAGPGDDVYVFIAGHGDRTGVTIGSGVDVLTPPMLRDAIAEGDRRRLLLAVEACNAGAFDVVGDLDDVAVLTAASVDEVDHGSQLDRATGRWLADDFALQLWRASSTLPPSTDVRDAAATVVGNVHGSTVGVVGDSDVLDSGLADYVGP